MSVLPSGLSSRNWWFPCPAVFGSRRRAIPGSVPWVAACVQWPRQPLRSQVQSQRFWPCGGAGAQGAGRDSLLHRVLGYVHQWSLPGRRKNLRPLLFSTTEEYTFLSLHLSIGEITRSQNALIVYPQYCEDKIERWPTLSSLSVFGHLRNFRGSKRDFSETKTCDLDQLLLRKSEKCIFQRTHTSVLGAATGFDLSEGSLGELEDKYADHMEYLRSLIE